MDIFVHTGLHLWTVSWCTESLSWTVPPPADVALLKLSERELADVFFRKIDDSILKSARSFDDIHTEDLQFLLKNFLVAHALSSGPTQDVEERGARLKAIRELFENFVRTTALYFDSDKTTEKWLNDLATKGDRDTLVRRRREMQELKRAITPPTTLFSHPEDRWGEEARNFWLQLVELAMLESTNMARMLAAEAELIANRPPEASRSEAIASKSSRPPLMMHFGSADEVRAAMKLRVFKPGHNLPTMSLDEMVAKEYHQDVEILQAAQKRSQEKYVRHSGDCSDAHDSDDSDRGEPHKPSESEERAWDDWKDENPRGSGNKMVNRG